MEFLIQLDEKVLLFFNGFSGGALDFPMDLLAFITKTPLLILINCLLILLFVRNQKIRTAIAFSVPLYVIQLGTIFFKVLFSRPRPFTTDLPVNLINYFYTPGANTSFPSGHSIAAFAAAALLSELADKRFRVLYLVAFVVAIGRLYLGVHYPSDVIAGALIGFVLGELGGKLSKRVFLENGQKKLY